MSGAKNTVCFDNELPELRISERLSISKIQGYKIQKAATDLEGVCVMIVYLVRLEKENSPSPT